MKTKCWIDEIVEYTVKNKDDEILGSQLYKVVTVIIDKDGVKYACRNPVTGDIVIFLEYEIEGDPDFGIE